MGPLSDPSPPFIDTSAIYAILDASDEHHAAALAILRARPPRFITHELMLVESISVVDRRLGQEPLDQLLDVIMRDVRSAPVDRGLFDRSLAAFRARERRRLSFVDSVTIEFCRQHGINEMFAFDDDLERAGLTALQG